MALIPAPVEVFGIAAELYCQDGCTVRMWERSPERMYRRNSGASARLRAVEES
jgi:hypothetical protein